MNLCSQETRLEVVNPVVFIWGGRGWGFFSLPLLDLAPFLMCESPRILFQLRVIFFSMSTAQEPACFTSLLSSKH